MLRSARVLVVAAVTWTVIAGACGTQDDPPTDAGFDSASPADGGDAGDAGGGPGPMIPWLDGEPPVAHPDLTPCPEGWRVVMNADGIAHCDPYPMGGALACPTGEAHFPGETGCTPVGRPCPAGDFSDALPTDRPVVYVLAGAARGGDGTRAAPYAGFDDRGATFPAGSAIAIGKGTYAGPIPSFRDTAIYGACAAQTVLSPATTAGLGFVVQLSGASEVHDLQIGPSPLDGLGVASSGAAVAASGLVITGVSTAVSVSSGTLSADRIVVHGVRGNPGSRAAAIVLLGSNTMRRVIVDGHAGDAINMPLGGSLTLEDSVFRSVMDPPGGLRGRAALLNLDAGSELRRLLVEDSVGGLVLTTSASASMTPVPIEDVVIRRMRPTSQPDTFENITPGLTIKGVPAALRRIHLADHTPPRGGLLDPSGASLVLSGDMAVTVDDLLIERATTGIFMTGALDARLSRVRIAEATQGELVYFSSVPGQVTVEDYWSGPGVFELPEPWYSSPTTVSYALTAPGIQLRGIDRFDLRRGIVDGAGDFGVGFHNGREMRLEDVLVRRLRAKAWGVSVLFRGEELSGRRVVAEDSIGVGASLAAEALALEDVAIRRIAPSPFLGRAGRGMEIGLAVGTINGMSIEDVHEVAFLTGAGPTLDLTNFRISNVQESSCYDCDPTGGGFGLAAVDGASINARGFTIEGAATCGVLLGEEGGLDMSDGEVGSSAIGACIQQDGFDVGRISMDVAYRDNGSPIQATTLPVPSPTPVR